MKKPNRIGRVGLAVALLGAALCVAAGSFTSVSAVVADTVQWSRWANSGPVPARGFAPSMAYDAERKNTVLFGGRVGVSRVNDTWVWHGASWEQKLPATPPAARNAAAMAYDALHKNVVLFGGESANFTELNDTWTWNGTDWSQVTTVHSPPAREFASMAYDSVTHQIVLFGGLTFTPSSTLVDDTWTFDGTDWTEVFPATVPSPRDGMTLQTDPSSGHIVMFGGNDDAANSHFLDETWRWNGSEWSHELPANSPNARQLAAMAADTDTKTVVLFGGGGTSDVQDLWSWNGSNWTQRFPTVNPDARSGAVMAYDAYHHQTVLTGGFAGNGTSDTWLLDSAPSAPTAVKATAHANAKSVVSWTAPANNGGSAITGYHVTTLDGTTLAALAPSCSTTAATTCTVTGLANGHPYRFRVTATNAIGTSAASAVSAAVVPAAPPAAPTKVVASSNLDRKSGVSWVAPANHGAAITKYTVTATPSGRTCTAAVTHCTVLGLTNGVGYRFSVKATNVAGTGPASALSAVATPRTVPGAVTITKVVTGVGTIGVSWGPAATTGGSVVTGYNVYSGTVSGKQSSKPLNAAPLHVRSFTWHATRGVTYYITVRAINARGLGAVSKQVAAKAK